jgi:hypothetical protein
MENSKNKNQPNPLTGIQWLYGQKITFHDPLPDVHVASMPLSGCAWIDTAEGVVLIDTLLGLSNGEEVA